MAKQAPWWQWPRKWFTTLERRELTWLLVGLGGCILLLAFLKLASEVMEGDTIAFDKKIILAFRKADNASLPIGPAWTTSVLMDLTALGGPTVIALGRARDHRIPPAADAVLDRVLHLRDRLERGSGQLRDEGTLCARAPPWSRTCARRSRAFLRAATRSSRRSFISRWAQSRCDRRDRLTKTYILAVAMFLTFIISVDRVWLGVRYPTDVLAGSIVGLFWASLCWLVAQHYEVARRHPRREAEVGRLRWSAAFCRTVPASRTGLGAAKRKVRGNVRSAGPSAARL